MNNYFGQPQRHSNNKYMSNNLLNGYQNFKNNNTPFLNNSMLMESPQFMGSIRDPTFLNRMNMAKMERFKNVKSVSELGLSSDQLTNYVICPIKVERMDRAELDKKHGDVGCTYIGLADDKKVPEAIREWWKKRKNTPYKTVLNNLTSKDGKKIADYTKVFKSMEDLLIHKSTQLDKDKIKLWKEYEEMMGLFEIVANELKIIYSASEESKHKQKFDYVQTYKHRIKYDPKNYNELKKFYSREQRKYNKENKRLDEMIELVLASEDISAEEITELKNAYSNDDDDDKITMAFEKGERELDKQIDKQLMKEAKKQLGSKKYKEVMNEIDKHIANNIDDSKEKSKDQSKKSNITIKSKEKPVDDDAPKKRITIRTKSSREKQAPEIGHVEEDELEKYKNRKKKNN